MSAESLGGGGVFGTIITRFGKGKFMEWIQGKIYTTTEGVEPVTGLLMTCGIDDTQIQDEEELRRFLKENPHQWDYIEEEIEFAPYVCVLFYTQEKQAVAAVCSALSDLRQTSLDLPLGSLKLELETRDDGEWKDVWKQYYKPFEVGERIIICPEWETYQSSGNKIILRMNPGHVFGTGLHQTTQLCVCQIERYAPKSRLVLDIGCGSGVLFIAAMLLGASHAFACDLEPDAITVASQNAAANRLAAERFSVVCGNVLTNGELRRQIRLQSYNARYDCITANITADAIIQLAAFVPQWLASGGVFIASGIIGERLAVTKAALGNAGLRVRETTSKEDWYCLAAHHA
jgi:ribosomal protein L11 methyltransferase